jgi:hypothetical protein
MRDERFVPASIWILRAYRIDACECSHPDLGRDMNLYVDMTRLNETTGTGTPRNGRHALWSSINVDSWHRRTHLCAAHSPFTEPPWPLKCCYHPSRRRC